jgi:hypothetical protein
MGPVNEGPTDSDRTDEAVGCGCLVMILLLVVGVAGFSFGRFALDGRDYRAGHDAYLAADCATAVERFDSVTGARRPLTPGKYADLARQEQNECQELLDVMAAEASEPPAALSRAAALVDHHPDSPLVAPARQRIAALAERVGTGALAGAASCGDVALVERTGLLPTPEVRVAELTIACAGHLADGGKADDAVKLLERFLARNPNHPATATATEALGRAMLAESRTGRLPAPERTGSTPGEPRLRIRNLSSRRMRMVLSGPVTRVVELPGCDGCVESTIIDPIVCGGTVVFDEELPGGSYRVVVRVIEDEAGDDDDDIRPFAGGWSLDQRSSYLHCLYIKTTLSFGGG